MKGNLMWEKLKVDKYANLTELKFYLTQLRISQYSKTWV